MISPDSALKRIDAGVCPHARADRTTGNLMTASSMISRAPRPAMALVALAIAGVALAGCMAGPTYGTAKGSNQQLLEDITGVLSVTPERGEQIEYKPRPELVRPASLDGLPEPRQNMAGASNPQWPESPEQRLARMRAEATANRDDIAFEPDIAVVPARRSAPAVLRTRGEDQRFDGQNVASADQRAEFNRRMAMSQQGSPTTRRYLSEPPLEYRRPAETAPADDVGEDEWRKERAARRAARQPGSSSWRDLLPW